jgi:hypothetical protein
MRTVRLGLRLSGWRVSDPHGPCSQRRAVHSVPSRARLPVPPHPVWRSVFARYVTGAATPVRSPIQRHYQAPSQIGLDSRRTGPSVRRRHLSLRVFHLDYQTGLSQSDSLPMPQTSRQRLWQSDSQPPSDAALIARSEACPPAILDGRASPWRRSPFPGSLAQEPGLFDPLSAHRPFLESLNHAAREMTDGSLQ